ncbi:MAG: hypothetical protein MJ215_05515 [Spirochaetia bacterium]|nr:hypothetical protein [Spirochaetia bacterium]
MKNDDKIIIGMPAGSLANPARGGNLVDLLAKAGFPAKGYDAGGPTEFTSVDFFFGWDGRPQEFGTQLAVDELDVAISGDDWMRERILELDMEYGIKIAPEKVLSLHRGNINLVGIVDGASPENTTEEFLSNLIKKQDYIRVVTELPYSALSWILDKLKKINAPEKFMKWSIQKYKTPAKIDSGIVIYEAWGKTEAKLKNGGADIGLEITQTGSALRNYGLKILEWVFQSEAGIWISQKIKKDPVKMDLLKMFLINLYGIINAENKVMLYFNVPASSDAGIRSYLQKNNLYAEEPTIISGREFSQYCIQLESASKTMPIAKVRYELIKLGARSIETVPILSSIPDLSVLNLL